MTKNSVIEPKGVSEYVGPELELFARARRWKAYLRERIATELGANVLEVGAGIGGTTALLADPQARTRESWVCLEPDPRQGAEIDEAIRSGRLPNYCSTQIGTLDDVGEARFETLLYIDVLEHIEHDQDELNKAAEHLQSGGKLVVLAPAHPWLFTPFDAAIGHYRRYTKSSLRALKPKGMTLQRLEYLDAVGLLASTANRCLLRQAMPTRKQIATWDRIMVPASRWVFDPMLRRTLGKSVLAVWVKV